jgi:hypothetical protein
MGSPETKENQLSKSIKSGICGRLQRESGGRISDIDGGVQSNKAFGGANISRRRSNVRDEFKNSGIGIPYLETKRSLNNSEGLVVSVSRGMRST